MHFSTVEIVVSEFGTMSEIIRVLEKFESGFNVFLFSNMNWGLQVIKQKLAVLRNNSFVDAKIIWVMLLHIKY